MLESFGAVGLPLIAAAMHPFLSRFIQKGTRVGVSLSVLVGVANVLTALIFLIYLRADWQARFQRLDLVAMVSGVIFFFGQYFSIRSVKAGDIAVHSSAMGVKILIVAALAYAVGLEGERPYLIPAAVVASFAVFIVAGADLAGWRKHRVTVGLTLLACLLFGINDFLTGWQAQALGSARWLTLMMGTSGLLSLGLLLTRRDQVRSLKWAGAQGGWTLAAGLLIGVQSLVVNIAFSHFQEPTLSNVAYSSRGVMAVVVLWALGERDRDTAVAKQLGGAVLILLALVLALQE